jgi:transaldolase
MKKIGHCNRLGIVIATQTYKAYRELLTTPHWQRLARGGARPQRLLWASTGVKDPAAPDTVNTMPEKTLHAFADHGGVKSELPADGGNAEAVLAEFALAGVDDAVLAAELQIESAKSFAKSWTELMDRRKTTTNTLGNIQVRELCRKGFSSFFRVDSFTLSPHNGHQ